MARRRIGIIGAGHIGGTLAHLVACSELGEGVLYDTEARLGRTTAKALDIAHMQAVVGSDVPVKGTSELRDLAGIDVAIVTAGVPRTPGMSREDLLETNLGIIRDVSAKLKATAPGAFTVVLTNPLDAMVHALWKWTGMPKQQVVGMAGQLDTGRFRYFVADALGCSPTDVHALVLGGHGDDMVPLVRHTRVGGIPLTELLPKDKIEALVRRTRYAGAELVKLYGDGSAYFAPAAAAYQLAEAYLDDRKRVLACSTMLDGQYGVKGYFLGVPVVIGAGGVEKVVEMELDAVEREMLARSFESVKAAVATIRW